ncbi:MAG: VPLPA-CTERM sorting domain-containing protein [Planctomycetota bacterium]|jgi:hypothetical protein
MATADIVYTPISSADYAFGIGLFNPDDPFTLNSVYVTYGNQPIGSDTFTFTFAAHMVPIYYNARSLHFNFVYDNTNIEVLRATPLNVNGIWNLDNYGGLTDIWPNPSSGLISVSSLFQSIDTGSAVNMVTSSIVPFFQVQLHVKDAQESHLGFFGITQMTLVSNTFNLTLFPVDFNYFGGMIHSGVPAPAGAWVLVAGLSGIGGAITRRRRRT